MHESNRIVKYFKLVLIYGFILNTVFFINLYNVVNIYQKTLNKEITKNIEEYHEINLRHLCRLSTCTEIGIIGKKYYKFSNDKLFPSTNPIEYKLWKITRNQKLDRVLNIVFNPTINKNILIKIPKYDLIILSNSTTVIEQLLKIYLYLIGFFILLMSVIFSIYEYHEHSKNKLNRFQTNSLLREKNMQILTENIHHELNTPVAIIQGALEKLEKLVNCPNCTFKTSCSIQGRNTVDFEMLYSSIDQINGVLERMSNFKNIRYSNGNKTIYNILYYSANSMSIYKAANFNIDLDEDSKNWGLKHGKGYLENVDLLNIVSNHFRNSIEASSSIIKVQTKIIKHNEENYISIFIIDNGTGLRDKHTGLLLSSKNYNIIFKDYYSSKNKEGESKFRKSDGFLNDLIYTYSCKIKKIFGNKTIFQQEKNTPRGVGLYLNKELLKTNHGDLKLRETSENGTVFEIIVPVVPFKR